MEIGLSETFIRGHVERLPGPVELIEGTPPKWHGKTMPLRGPLERGFRKLRRLLHADHQANYTTAAYIALLRKIKADVVLAEYGPCGVRVFPACKALGIPLVVHFHGYDASKRDTLEQFRVAYRHLFDEAAGIVVVSQAMRERLLELGAPPEKLHYNVYGIDPAAFPPVDVARSGPSLVGVGRFVDKKAPHLTILAFSRIADQYPDARLCMIGYGPLWGACQDLVQALGLTGRVELLGAQPHERVQAEMQQARAFVQHSLVAESGDSEGTPVAILEASMSGVPVVATRHAGIPDVIQDGVTGLLMAEHDVEAMATQMARVLGDVDLAARLGMAARNHALAQFTMDQSIERLWDIIQESVARYRAEGAR